MNILPDWPESNSFNARENESDWGWIIKFGLLIMFITSIPYLLGYFYEGDSWIFTGFVFGVEDGNSYIAKMLRGTAGEWFFRTPYTVEPQSGVIAFFLYTLLGKLAHPPETHIQLVALFQIFRFLAGMFSIAALYKFIAFFIPGRKFRRWGIVLGALGGGLGWLAILIGAGNLFGSIPLDFYSPETFGFLSLYGLPHLALARGCMLLLVLYVLRIISGLDEHVVSNAIFAGICWLIVGLAQPLSAVLIGLILFLGLVLPALFVFFRKKMRDFDWPLWRRGWIVFITAGLIVGPFILYTLVRFRIDPFLRSWTDQNIIRSPHPFHYMLAYGLILPFSIAGIKPLLRLRPIGAWVPIIWVALLPILVYSPYNLQRRLAEGSWIAFVCLGMAAANRMQGWRKALMITTPAMLVSSLMLLIGGILAVRSPGLPLFRPVDEIKAFTFLARHAEIDDVVLASYDTGNALPAWAPIRVLIGHGPESVEHESYSQIVEEFYRPVDGSGFEKDIVLSLGIKYVFWGPNERMIGDWNPNNLNILKLVYSENNYNVYQVK